MSLRPSDREELVGLLGELSAQEERVLLRARGLRRMFEVNISATAAGLSSLERHLLRGWREEVAFILQALGVDAIRADPANPEIPFWHTTRRQFVPPSRETIELRIARARQVGLSSAAPDLATVIENCLPGHDPEHLLRSSLQLVETASRRTYCGIVLAHRRQLESSVQEARRALRIAPDGINESCARERVAHSLLSLGRLDEAVETILPAARRADPTPFAPLLLLWIHLNRGDAHGIISSARLLDGAVEVHHPAIDVFLRAASRRGSVSGRKLPSIRPDELGGPSRVLSHAFLH